MARRPPKPEAPETSADPADAFAAFHPVTAEWFNAVFDAPTLPQRMGWPVIARGENALILAPTGTGKTLTAFLWCLDRLMLHPRPSDREQGTRIVYVSPLKALAVDVERNLRSPLAGIANMARRMGIEFHDPTIAVRTGDTPQQERARYRRDPADILITTPESLYLLLTSQAAEALRNVDTIIIDEIHALVPTKRGAHLALTLERLEALVARPIQRIGLSATQRPLEEVARFLGGVEIQGVGSREKELEISATPDERDETAPIENALKAQTSGRDDSAILLPTPYSLLPASPVLLPGSADAEPLRYRPVTIVNASARKELKLRIEVPVEDMARLNTIEEIPSGPASQGPKRVSIWDAIHPRLLEIIRERTSTILFVNSRQIAERLAGALNELAGEPVARAHHGSLAASQRAVIEEQLKAGQIKALCATSTLELGIDMGAVDLVIQIESPPSVASGMQRIGRAGHSVDTVSEGVLFPKYRADLVACAAVTRAMHEGHIESTRYPRNPLDVLAQQMVAIVAHPPVRRTTDQTPAPRKTASKRTSVRANKKAEAALFSSSASTADAASPAEVSVDDLYNLVRRAAPFGGLTRSAFDGVLDLLSGRYPSDEFAELRPRLTWDRVANTVTAREGAGRLAILNAGTIPDRGLYGVFLAHQDGKSVRVGELDEEMVFESHPGETFILGASTWRIVDITHDRVLVEPAPGEPGKMPFWKGDGPGRPLEFGRRIGALIRELREVPKPVALTRLVAEHDLDPNAAENLVQFLDDQQAATGQIPDDRNIVIERVRDELGDWRMCVLTPFGSRIHIPWAMAVAARMNAAGGPDVEMIWGDDGFVLRFPDTDGPPDPDWIMVESREALQLVLRQLGSTALFAGRFREAAGRALLLPRRRPDQRSPLWQLRKRSYDLLSVASRYPSFPLLLEAYRECLRDVFDMPALVETLRAIEQRQLRVHVVETRKASPFASSLLFSYVANFIYDGDAPLAERRAQALTIDQEQLREILGEADLRELLDPDAIAEVEETAQCLAENYRARSADGIHDLLLKLGDLSREELSRRIISPDLLDQVDRLLRARRVLELRIAGERRLIAAEDAARYRDALGVPLPPGIGASLLEPVAQPVLELVRRYARTHGPFTTKDVAARFGLDAGAVENVLRQLGHDGRVLEGGFVPGGLHREWCDAEILRQIRRKSLARLRREVEPVEQHTLARFLTQWQGLLRPRNIGAGRGQVHLDALLDVIESLQGAPIPASLLETSILPARIAGYDPAWLDTLIAAGEVAWVGVEPLGERDGRIALYLADKLPLLLPARSSASDANPMTEREEKLLAALEASGASFFEPLHQSVGGGYPGESIDALWSLVWRGLVTNDSLHALRAYIQKPDTKATRRPHQTGAVFRSRRTTPPNAQGRWSVLPVPSSSTPKSLVTGHDFSRADQSRTRVGALAADTTSGPSGTERSHALAMQLLSRYGVLLREQVAAENIPGGFSAVYDVLKALEESGRIRRGYFVAGLGATQFALPAAVDLLRQLRAEPDVEKPEFVQIAATDPANPYGSVLNWPDLPVAEEDSNGVPADRSSSAGRDAAPRVLTRAAYAEVILRNGELVAWVRRNNPNLLVFLPAEEPERSRAAEGLAQFLSRRGQERMQSDRHQGVLITTINGQPAAAHPMARFLMDAGFHLGPLGLHLRRVPMAYMQEQAAPEEWQ
ncbi:Lhr family helicase [Occallatibacter riparius]|uniref:DEAD/DEAH box helicase n=1 Tax=Occallatibacter riparius TaxID=1002689 RepID=A0A9J7BVG9_9BACT|nr:DEAD/DEAH box helicase [Occallatibacter riparius]UWZ86624.1 DEAD/DEAH box helicase [Occallatibacter riparius]